MNIQLIKNSINEDISKELRVLVTKFFSANIVVVILQTISSLAVANMISPAYMGYFVTASIVMTYIPFFMFGITNGLNRQYPYLIGQGKVEESILLRDTAFYFAIISSFVIFLLVMGIAVYFYLSDKIELSAAFLSYSIMAAFYPVTIISEVCFRTNHDFLKLSRIKIINVCFAVVTVFIVYLWGYKGMLVRSAFMAVFYFLLFYFLKPFTFALKFKKESFFTLIRIGAPIFIWGFAYGLYIGLDKIFILKYFSPETMGYYVPSIQIGSALGILPISFFQIIYPRLCHKYGEEKKIKSLLNLLVIPQKYMAIFLIPVFGIAIWFMDPVVKLILPKYQLGIPAARWMVVAIYFKCLTITDIFVAIAEMKYYAICLTVAAVVFFLAFELLHQYEWGLSSVTAAFALSTLVFNLTSYLLMYRLIYLERKSDLILNLNQVDNV